MRLYLERFGYGNDSTLGELSLVEDGTEPSRLCFTVEDERRKVKVPGETCIPTGVYHVTLRTEGKLHEKYSHRFPEMHRGMLWIRNVPDFEYVYLHIGNTDDDTEGCPLVVTTPVITPDGEFRGVDSTTAYVNLYKLVMRAMDVAEDVVISVGERSEK